ncbi:ATP-binding protein [Bacillus altitudinis]|uniref:ATP-binding protein n=1 Tax=Bacillus altitudinis TaxID=293387 RepID=UPI003F7C6111
MSKIPFKVSARAARLIGRENVSNAESAVIELVKNSYDADGNGCVLFLINQYEGIPNLLSMEEYETMNNQYNLSSFYEKEDKHFKLIDSNLKNKNLENFFLSFNTLYILDDGSGMAKETIENEWMTIGTNNKEHNYISKKGRIQTGAKGIGRFALDRLGSSCTMYTIKNDQSYGHNWDVHWDEFEKENIVLNEVYADINQISRDYFKSIIKKRIFDKIDFSKYEEDQLEGLEELNFNKGTLFEIRGLRDRWENKSIVKLYKSLDSLIPPKEERVFDIYLFASKSYDFGVVKASICNDFDYKLVTTVNDDLVAKIKIYRDEIPKNKIDNELFKMKGFGEYPYDKETFERGFFTESFALDYLLPECSLEELNDLKNFTFTMYFMKRDFNASDTKKFGYKHFNSGMRKDWLNRYGGIKIFRDHFRVRPYGEIDSTAFDWLRLGDRVQKSPAAVAGKGAWRVRANQISGTIAISRENNVFEDKSSREGLQETKLFDHFQKLIVKLIFEFEKDRAKVMSAIKKLNDKKNEREIIKEQGKGLANETIKYQEERLSNEVNINSNQESKGQEVQDPQKRIEQLEKDKLLLAQSYKIIEETVEEKENELKLLRALAGTGIALTSLAHEIKTISAPLVTKNQHLKFLLEDIPMDESKSKQINSFIDVMSEKDRVLKGWLDVALNIVSKDKRRRHKINIYDVITKILKAWDPPLKEKNIRYEIVMEDQLIIEWRVHIIDIESIINNLIINSIISLQSKHHIGERIIIIELNRSQNFHGFELTFRDNGPGLSKEIRDKDDIFIPLFSTRTEEGTGLGLWIVKTIVEEYKGDVKVGDVDKGFMLKFKFPLRKGEGITNEI